MGKGSRTSAILNIAARSTIFTFSLAQNICAVVESMRLNYTYRMNPKTTTTICAASERHYRCCSLRSPPTDVNGSSNDFPQCRVTELLDFIHE